MARANRVSPFLLWMAVILLATSCATTGRDPEASYDADRLTDIGEKFLAASDVAQAIKYLTMAEKKQPKDPKVQYLLGLAYEVRGLPDDALAHYQNAVAIKPDYSEVYNNLGSYYASRNDFVKAEEYYRKALANPAYGTPHYSFFNLGRLAEKRGDLEGALKEYDHAIRLYPSYGVAYYRKGVVLESLRRPEEAKEAYSQAILYAPDLAEAHLRFAVMCYSAGEIEHALYSFSRVIRLNPHSPGATEAKRYLERMQGIMIGEGSKTSPYLSGDRLAQVEVVTDRESLERVQAPAKKPSTISREEALSRAQRNLKTAGVGLEVKENGKGAALEGTATYIVQAGSFLEKRNADRLAGKLSAQGYESLVREFPHQSKGKIYVVQLKPVEDAVKANALMAAIEKAAQLKPIVIKVPVGP